MPWLFYDQGNANVLFYDTNNEATLLRVRKVNSGVSAEHLHLFWKQYIYPSLGSFCINQKLVALDRDLISSIKKDNPAVVFDGTVSSGLVIPRIGPFCPQKASKFKPHNSFRVNCDNYNGNKRFVVQFKPKWLVQSPNAPVNARGCRNCALYLKRNGSAPGFCMLDLSSKDSVKVKRVFTSLLQSYMKPSTTIDNEIDNAIDLQLDTVLTEFWLASSLCSRLIQLQSFDKQGILAYGLDSTSESKVTEDLLVAMSARDCTVYLDILKLKNEAKSDLEKTKEFTTTTTTLQINDCKYQICAKVGDLDPKPDTKKSYWYDLESSLDYCADELTCRL